MDLVNPVTMLLDDRDNLLLVLFDYFMLFVSSMNWLLLLLDGCKD